MVENGRDCSEVLVQLAAVKSALNNTGKLILKEHISAHIGITIAAISSRLMAVFFHF